MAIVEREQLSEGLIVYKWKTKAGLWIFERKSNENCKT